MEPIERKAVPRAISGNRVDLFVSEDDGVFPVDLPDPLPQVSDQLIESLILSLGGKIPIEIADQADTDRNVIQVIAVDVATGELAHPTIADFNLSVTGGRAIADNEMVSKPVRHLAHVPMIVIKNPRVPLSCSRIVHDGVLPAIAGDAGFINRLANSWREIPPQAGLLRSGHRVSFFLRP